MTPADWERLSELLLELAAAPEAHARARLAALPDAAEREFLARLLAADGAPWPWLEAPLFPPEELAALAPGTRLGPWEVTGELGRGGMGVVHAGRRADGLYEQAVAIKVLVGAEADLARRFDLERRILAGLEHAAITRLLDAGLGPEQVPYLVMEAVRGLPIDQFCAERNLDVAGRVALFAEVAEAVAHAHRRLVVHCDLKPSNILVTADGQPKLLDFGIAQLLAPGPEEAGSPRRRLTPAYASPEQLRGNEPLTTATDIYSLGAVLKHLLDALPAPPGRDLAAIVARATAAEISARYGTVEELIADLRRLREGRPVAARPATVPYRLVRFLGRHRLAVGVAALMVVLAVLGVLRLERERARAETERENAEEVAAFLTGLFRDANPAAEEADPDFAQDAAGRAARERLLDEGRERLATAFRARPERRVVLLAAIGEAYRHLGRFDKAAPLLEEALALEPRPAERASRWLDLCRLRLGQGQLAAAEAACREALVLRSEPLARAEVDNELGLVLRLRGEPERAEQLFAAALAVRRALLPTGDRALTASLNNLALVRQERGDAAGAEPLLQEVLTARRKRLGEDHLLVIQAENNLASVHQDLGRTAEATAGYRSALDRAVRGLGPQHPLVAALLNNLGSLELAAGRAPQAQEAFARAHEIATTALGPDHPETAGYRFNLAVTRYRLGDRPTAAHELEAVLASRTRRLGAGHPDSATTLFTLVRVERELGRTGSARARLATALAAWQQQPPADPAVLAQARALLAGGGGS
ncbi:MAG: tetratricopeptide repeat protein [Thermoanaerobaculia bacterium]|nr:tetratricopeptide repeat protein [Thermoanaerobaculia bacterium]